MFCSVLCGYEVGFDRNSIRSDVPRDIFLFGLFEILIHGVDAGGDGGGYDVDICLFSERSTVDEDLGTDDVFEFMDREFDLPPRKTLVSADLADLGDEQSGEVDDMGMIVEIIIELGVELAVVLHPFFRSYLKDVHELGGHYFFRKIGIGIGTRLLVDPAVTLAEHDERE